MRVHIAKITAYYVITGIAFGFGILFPTVLAELLD